jgi:23S rRNA (pseudouridine1915-N3)-methyltransferase
MKISLISIGKFDKPFYNQYFEFYKKRLKWQIELIELDLKNSNNLEPEKIKDQEGKLIEKYLKNCTKIIALDENGKQFSSIELAKNLENIGIEGNSNIAFIIGGAFGLSQDIKKKANILMSLSKLTFPHLMVRIILIEQIYRASTIIFNHPYHKV